MNAKYSHFNVYTHRWQSVSEWLIDDFEVPCHIFDCSNQRHPRWRWTNCPVGSNVADQMLTGSVWRHTPVKRDPEFLCETRSKILCRIPKMWVLFQGRKLWRRTITTKFVESFSLFLGSAVVIMFDYFNTASLEYRWDWPVIYIAWKAGVYVGKERGNDLNAYRQNEITFVCWQFCFKRNMSVQIYLKWNPYRHGY